MSPSPFWIETDDWHTAGEPFRIVDKLPSPLPSPNAVSISLRHLSILWTSFDSRYATNLEVMPIYDARAAFGVLFWHKDGFSTACGHGTIALGYWAVAKGLIRVPENGTVDVVIDVPSGRVVASMTIAQGKPIHADFINVASYQIAKSLPVAIPSRGVEVSVDLAFSGAIYATLGADQLGLKVEPRNVDEFIRLGREVKASLGKRAHYGIYDCYGVIFFNEEEDEKANGHGPTVKQRNVTVFADGQIDRSPCGSGTCARLAVLHAQGRLGPKQSKLQHRSIIASSFEADIVSEAKSPVEGFPGCIPRVQGKAKLCGKMSFFIDPTEDIYPGFLLR